VYKQYKKLSQIPEGIYYQAVKQHIVDHIAKNWIRYSGYLVFLYTQNEHSLKELIKEV